MPTFKVCWATVDWTLCYRTDRNPFYVGNMPDFERWCELCSLAALSSSVDTQKCDDEGFCKRFLWVGWVCAQKSKGFNWHHYMSHRGLNNCLDIWCPAKLPFIAQSYFLLNFLVMLSFFASLCVKFTVHSLSCILSSSVGRPVSHLLILCACPFEIISCDLLFWNDMRQSLP